MYTPEESPAAAATQPTPVFLDLTGRRLKRARLVGGTVMSVVAAYVVLLLSAALGGPSIDAPFLPRAAGPTRGLAALPSAASMTDLQARNGVTTAGSRTSTGQAAVLHGAARAVIVAVAATTTSPAPAGPAMPAAKATSIPVATTGTPIPPATTPTATPTVTPTHTGRSASAPGHTARPTVSRTH